MELRAGVIYKEPHRTNTWRYVGLGGDGWHIVEDTTTFEMRKFQDAYVRTWEEWKEPKRIKVWVNVLEKNGNMTTSVNLDDGYNSTGNGWNVFARFSYEVTEG